MIGFSSKKRCHYAIFTLQHFVSKIVIITLFLNISIGFQSCSLQKKAKKTEEEKNTSNFDFSELNKKLLVKNEKEEIRYIDLITDFDGKKIRVGISETDTSWQNLKAHEFGNFAYYLGILNVDWNAQPHSNLQLLSLNVPITEIAMMEARSPNDVKISAEQINKLAIIEGYSSGGMIYKANIVAVFEDKPMDLLMLLLQKNEITPYLRK
ncbi:MAG: hypothetical protein ACPG5B_10210 [Chitinophagales bacterium]